MSGDPQVIDHWLKTVGYYRLSAYWLIWELPPAAGVTRSKRFKPPTRFESVRDLYIFDRELRLLAMEAIDRIEIALRSRWTNRFAIQYGAHGHLHSQNFRDTNRHKDLLRKLKFSVSRSKEVFIKHYRSKYTQPKDPPLWAASELMSFGELSKWYSDTKDNRIKIQVARDLGFPSIKTFEGALQLLAYVRNICAHHARFWNRKTVKRAPIIDKMRSDLQLTNASGTLEVDNSVYNALTLIAHTLRSQSPDTSFSTRVSSLLSKQPSWQLRLMGFPTDWRRRPIWRTVRSRGFLSRLGNFVAKIG
ncbi:Abi family protein [Qipengyuania flava]|uniref:Abi family protein n=1 Tax=Qipengyuania flava TaxID=192812 RepID=UPI00273F1D3C|nr:Abi family protein [Qipengyuania flava]